MNARTEQARGFLEQRRGNSEIWRLVIKEEAMVSLTYGVRLGHNACDNVSEDSLHQRVIRLLYKAVAVYENDLSDVAQAAATHFQIASHCSRHLINVSHMSSSFPLARRTCMNEQHKYEEACYCTRI